jgi:hypothetical protein
MADISVVSIDYSLHSVRWSLVLGFSVLVCVGWKLLGSEFMGYVWLSQTLSGHWDCCQVAQWCCGAGCGKIKVVGSIPTSVSYADYVFTGRRFSHTVLRSTRSGGWNQAQRAGFSLSFKFIPQRNKTVTPTHRAYISYQSKQQDKIVRRINTQISHTIKHRVTQTSPHNYPAGLVPLNTLQTNPNTKQVYPITQNKWKGNRW